MDTEFVDRLYGENYYTDHTYKNFPELLILIRDKYCELLR